MDKVKKWATDHKVFTIIAITLFILFVVPPFMNWVVTAPSWFSSLGFINDTNRNAWIGFYGAIIGGGITLGGVAWTISNQNKKRDEDLKNREQQRKDDLAIQYKPFLLPMISNMLLDASCLKVDAQPSRPIYDSENHKIGTEYDITHKTDIVIQIKNGGRGEALIKDIVLEPGWNPTTNSHVSVSSNFDTIINPKEFLKFVLHIELYNYDSFTTNSQIYYDYYISIKYTDFLGIQSFNRDLTLYIMNNEVQDFDGATSIDEESGLPKTEFSIIIQ